jgi:hypothetical protein
MRTATRIKVGKFTALAMLGFYGLVLLMLMAIGLLSLMGRAWPRWYNADLICCIAALAFLYAVFAYSVTRGHRKVCLLVLVVLFIDTFFLKLLTGAMIFVIPRIAAFIPFGDSLLLGHPHAFWTICGCVMLAVLLLLQCGVTGVYKSKAQGTSAPEAQHEGGGQA